MRPTALHALLPLSLLLAPAAAAADPERLNNPAPPPPPPPPPAPPPAYEAPPPVAGYSPPPPVTGYNPPPPAQRSRPQPVTMSPQPMLLRPMQPPPPAHRQGLFAGVLGGGAIPLAGDYASLFGPGFMGLGHVGWATGTGVSARVELGVRSNAPSDPGYAGTALTSVFYGAGLRWTAPRAVLRPYVEALVDAFSTLEQATDDGSGTTTTTSSSGATGVSVGAAVGAEVEVSSTLSLELAVRYDHVVVNGDDSGLTGGLLGVLGGATFSF